MVVREVTRCSGSFLSCTKVINKRFKPTASRLQLGISSQLSHNCQGIKFYVPAAAFALKQWASADN